MKEHWPTPYWACIFHNQRLAEAEAAYAAMSEEMLQLASQQPGYLGVESVRDAEGAGITVSYWQSRAAIAAWGRHAAHLVAQRQGRDVFYDWFTLRIAEVHEERHFTQPKKAP